MCLAYGYLPLQGMSKPCMLLASPVLVLFPLFTGLSIILGGIMDRNKQQLSQDEKLLQQMGYKQELARRMGGFSNFAISFSIICILAGGITAFPAGLSAAGGASIGIGWPLGALFALIVAAGMGQIASAFPTAGGLYHWSSILGGKGWGWATAWFNVLGLIFVVASVNVGLWDLIIKPLLLTNVFGMDVSTWGNTHKWIAVALITASQALFNHFGIRLTTRLTDFSGYLIFTVAIILTIALLAFAPSFDLSRLFTFSNYTGAAGGGVWPQFNSLFIAFLSGLILVCYTITGFDASAHTSEETHNATSSVPRGMINAVLWSALFGYLMICSFVLSMPSVPEGAAQGWSVFGWTMANSGIPAFLQKILFVGITLANYLCALAGVTSCSRMIYAFARDGGLPRFLSQVHPEHRTPVNAIWLGALLSFLCTLYTPAFLVLSAGCAVFLYISYIMPIIAGLFTEGRSWTHKGAFNLGVWSKPIAILAILGGAVLAYVGMRPPYEKVGYLVIALAVVLAVVWFAVEARRFQGPPAVKFED
jgi:amino acid transporter